MIISLLENKIILLFSILSVTIPMTSCDWAMPPEPIRDNILNSPNEELSNTQLLLHLKGDAEFGRKFSTIDGLGPIFVSNSCESCHFADGKGHPSLQLIRFGKNKQDGSFDHMIDYGGPQLQNRSIEGYPAEKLPDGVTGKSIFIPPSVAGLGFIANVDDASILALADPFDSNGDGISGIPNYISPPDYFVPKSFHIPNNGKYIGRFGRKAAAIDLQHQIVNAYHQDMGITSDFAMYDLHNYITGSTSTDNVPDPEIPANTVNLVVFYVATLAAPPRRNTNDPDIIKGEESFNQAGCANCHSPNLKTGFSNVNALSNKTFHPYSDLLLHDMGPELNDNYTEGTALTSEWRTTPLWGLGLSPDSQGGKLFLLHDGRAETIEEAIEFHGGEASSSRENFKTMTKQEKVRLIKFLMSL